MISTSGPVGLVLGIIILWVGCALLAALIGPGRGWARRKAFLVAMLLGPAGLAMVVVLDGGAPEPGVLERQQEQQRQWEASQHNPGHPFDGPTP